MDSDAIYDLLGDDIDRIASEMADRPHGGRPMTETHTGCYRDVAGVPADAMASAASFVIREWGEQYAIGYVGCHDGGSAPQTFVYVFQVRARDGSRFAIGTTRWGDPFELEGRAWLAFLQNHDIEATLKGCT